jgi:threonine aldolase
VSTFQSSPSGAAPELRPIELRSDNTAGVAPEILEAITAADRGSAAAYGGDDLSARLRDRVAEVFEHDDVSVFPVLTGTAANSIGLSALCPPWGAVLCHETSHIIRNECGATSMFGAGAVMRGLAGPHHRLDVRALEQAFASTNWGDPHHSQPSVLSLTNPTDGGTVYDLPTLMSLGDAARARGLRFHIDGARIANAIAALGCRPADVTWRAGVDMVSLGATKNGVMSTDAIVCFDPALTDELTYRVKRAGQVASKMRYQSAQLDAYLTDGLWLRLAGRANAAMSRLAKGLGELGLDLVDRPDANIAFLTVDDSVADRFEHAGLLFYRTAPRTIRFVTSFRTTDDEVDDALGRIATAL